MFRTLMQQIAAAIDSPQTYETGWRRTEK